MKKSCQEIVKEIKSKPLLFDKIIKTDNDISAMIIITDFIVDFDSYYIDYDTELDEYLWEDVYELLKS